MTPLDADTLHFIQGGVSISVAAANAQRLACMARGMGCRPLAGGTRIAVFVRRSQAAELLDNIAQHGRVACVFNLPSSNRTVQLKGADARIEPFDPTDLPTVQRHLEDMAADAATLGTPSTIVHALLATTPSDLVTVVFTPNAAFSQTPGPQAGATLAPTGRGAPP